MTGIGIGNVSWKSIMQNAVYVRKCRKNERQNGTKETPTLPASFWNQTTLMNVVGRNLDKLC